jgi:post-segregation antitoxin (ccd killing protein)
MTQSSNRAQIRTLVENWARSVREKHMEGVLMFNLTRIDSDAFERELDRSSATPWQIFNADRPASKARLHPRS